MSQVTVRSYQPQQEIYESIMPFGRLIDELTADEIKTHELIESYSNQSSPRWRFISNTVTLSSKKPIKIQVEQGQELYFVSNERLAIYASGESIFKAFKDFDEQLIYFYNYYKNLSWDQVTGLACKIKQIYEENFNEE